MNMVNGVKPIETKYKGYRFRSRLEARWAVFFDALGIEWEYEKEGYDLGKLGRYLPDFWLANVSLRSDKPGMWAEIKHKNPTEEECDKFRKLVIGTEKHGIILLGSTPVAGSAFSDRSIDNNQHDGHHQVAYLVSEFNDVTDLWDNCETEKTNGKVSQFIQLWEELFGDQIEEYSIIKKFSMGGNCMNFMKCYNEECRHIKIEFWAGRHMQCKKCGSKIDHDHPHIHIAMEKARSARFEYGEESIK